MYKHVQNAQSRDQDFVR